VSVFRSLFLFSRGLCLILALMLALPGPAAAERGEDDGDYQILQASYGTALRHVDVTQRLKELARQDRRFRLVNELFGVDPAPGETKTLRIYTRGRDGDQHVFEYREHGDVDGSQFTGWGGGNWGQGGWQGGWGDGPVRPGASAWGHGQNGQNSDDGEYQILQASYGTERHHVDVTPRLKQLARQDRRFKLENNVFGVDPDPGRNKILRIYARGRDGQTRIFDYPNTAMWTATSSPAGAAATGAMAVGRAAGVRAPAMTVLTTAAICASSAPATASAVRPEM